MGNTEGVAYRHRLEEGVWYSINSRDVVAAYWFEVWYF